MNADLSILSTDEFSFKAGSVGGQAMVLVKPKWIGSVKWTHEKLIFRSSMWTPEGELVSAGFKKFFNAGEATQLFPPIDSLDGAEIMEKLDGSSLIVSHYKGQRIVRTRGTFDAHGLANGAEVPALIAKYQKFFDYCRLVGDGVSFICEWFTPSNKIVLSYGDEPKLWLVAAINHKDYSLASQAQLDEIAAQCDIARPRRFSFDSWEGMQAALQLLEGEEGYCVYDKSGQRIDKVKCPRYLILHKMKSDLSNVEKVVDLWLAVGEPKYQDFYNQIATTFDWELAEYCRGEISKICDAAKRMADIEAAMVAFVGRIKGQPRKNQAEAIFGSYGKNSNRAAMVFHVLDGKGLTKDDKKKLILQLIAE